MSLASPGFFFKSLLLLVGRGQQGAHTPNRRPSTTVDEEVGKQTWRQEASIEVDEVEIGR